MSDQPPSGSPSTSVLPYGAWPSPVTPELIVAASVGLSEVWVDAGAVEGRAVDDGSPDDGGAGRPAGGADVWWSELRPEEGGRVQLVRRSSDGTTTDMLPPGFAARTRVHEYGGGAWWLHRGTLFFVNWDDQRLHRLAPTDASPIPVTRPPAIPHGLRYADGRVTPDGRWVVCVRESHEVGGEAVNELVALPAEGGDALPLDVPWDAGRPDFVSNPRISPDGRWLAWVQWNHPAMPWDATELWVAGLAADEHDVDLTAPARVAGGAGEAVTQPEWSPDGVLHFLSDRDGWSKLYRFAAPGRPDDRDGGTALTGSDLDIGTPPWVFGMSRYAFVADGDRAAIAVACAVDGRDELHVVDAADPDVPGHRVDSPCTSFTCLKGAGSTVVAVGGSFVDEPVVLAVEVLDRPPTAQVLRAPRDLGIDRSWWSVPRHVTFPTGPDGAPPTGEAHGLYYPPTNPVCGGPAGSRPPLLVAIHGGPTSAARPQRQLGVQFWTSRGFGVLDVNYRGSTGYGRAYRRLLDGQWGITDVEDCAAGAGYLAAAGDVDGARLAIHGGSAGGFTTLMALITTDRFSAGTSSYGVTDLEALARDTHKFESRYLDGLVGPYPDRRDLYVARSPIHHLDELDDPVLLLQGLEDEIVPPSQAELLVAALRRNRVPFAYLTFEGEQHGFKQASTIRRALEAELVFYARVLGFDVPPDVEPLDIENLEEGAGT
jgi:dipeptidyl aminopeptidase/acylaminoacyl peptidase